MITKFSPVKTEKSVVKKITTEITIDAIPPTKVPMPDKRKVRTDSPMIIPKRPKKIGDQRGKVNKKARIIKIICAFFVDFFSDDGIFVTCFSLGGLRGTQLNLERIKLAKSSGLPSSFITSCSFSSPAS